MFESLSDRLNGVFEKLRSRGRVTEEDLKVALREVRIALLEADVSLKVVRQFIKSVEEKALGADVLKGLNPAQQVIKIVHDELVEMLGGGGAATAQHRRPSAERHHAGRAPGRGQDDAGGEAGADAAQAGPAADHGGGGPVPPGRRDPDPDPRQAARHPGLPRAEPQAAGPGPGRRQARRADELQLRHRGHGRPHRHRRGDDARGRRDPPPGQPAGGAAGRGRDDRPGRRQGRRAVPRSRSASPAWC